MLAAWSTVVGHTLIEQQLVDNHLAEHFLALHRLAVLELGWHYHDHNSAVRMLIESKEQAAHIQDLVVVHSCYSSHGWGEHHGQGPSQDLIMAHVLMNQQDDLHVHNSHNHPEGVLYSYAHVFDPIHH